MEMDPDIQTSLWKLSWLQSWLHYFHFWKEWWKEYDVFAICWYELDTGLRCNSSQGTLVVIMKCLKFWSGSQWVAVHMQTSTTAMWSGRKRGAQVCELSYFHLISCVCVCVYLGGGVHVHVHVCPLKIEIWAFPDCNMPQRIEHGCIYLEHETDLDLFSITHVQYIFQCHYSVRLASCRLISLLFRWQVCQHIHIYTYTKSLSHSHISLFDNKPWSNHSCNWLLPWRNGSNLAFVYCGLG